MQLTDTTRRRKYKIIVLAAPFIMFTLVRYTLVRDAFCSPNVCITCPPCQAIRETLTRTTAGNFRAAYPPPKAGRLNARLLPGMPSGAGASGQAVAAYGSGISSVSPSGYLAAR